MKPALFVWDFHGTLEQGNVQALHEILNHVAAERNLQRQISLEQTVQWYGLSWIDYFRYLDPRGTLETWNAMKQRAFEIQEHDHVIERYIKPTAYAEEVLRTIAERGHTNIIMSNTRNDQIRWFARMVGLDSYIKDFIGLDAHSEPREHTDIMRVKEHALRAYIGGRHYGKIIKIGDRESDIEAGKAVGAATYYYCNQFNKHHALKVQPDHFCSDLRDILKEI
ncbi:MAG: HAD hydrolase-like protein [Patescibacteria group bacterium]|nr:HAD hydrolase-like protein [Patescibacteria group bacterium]MDD5715258.1 HAD hydrolase-like protein [Patescibacteria group bacterium]